MVDTYVDQQGTQFYSSSVISPVVVDKENSRAGSTPAMDYAARFMLAQYAAFRFRRGTPQFENAKRLTGLDLSEAAAFAYQAKDDSQYGEIFSEIVRKSNNQQAMTEYLCAAQILFFTLPDAAQHFGSLGASVFQTPLCSGSPQKSYKYEIVDLGMFRCYCPACAIMSISNEIPFSPRAPESSVLHCVSCGTLIKCDKYYIINHCGFVCDACYGKFFKNQSGVFRAITLK